jgi:hypothetical protein
MSILGDSALTDRSFSRNAFTYERLKAESILERWPLLANAVVAAFAMNAHIKMEMCGMGRV